jgi:pimeloyl-ACP methyl ester carboxylesterase
MDSERAGGLLETRISFAALGGSGPNALLLHGFGSDRWSWMATQPAIESIATAFALDLPGHGDSGMDVGDGGVLTLARRIAGELDRRGLSKLHIIAHSLGGGLALILASLRPDLVASLILIAPAGLGEGVDPAFLAAFPKLETADETEALLRRLVVRPRLIGKTLAARVLDHLHKPGARAALQKIAEGLSNGAGALEDAARTVAARDLPRLVIWGESDAINPLAPDKAARFGGEFRLAAGAGHLPQIEVTRVVNGAIADFLRSVGGGNPGPANEAAGPGANG